jgi:hypothetical protein
MSEAHDGGDFEIEAEARALLRPAREPQAASDEVRARMLRRLSLALPVGGPGDPGTPAAPPRAGSGAAKGLARALATRVPAWSLLASFLAGGVIAVAVTRPSPSQSANHEVTIEASTAAPSALVAPVTPPAPAMSAPAIAVAPLASAAPAAIPMLSARPAASIASARADGSSSLEAERALLDVARTALGRGDGENALRATAEHGRKFPRGILSEEREAMSIQALRLLHRDDEAQVGLEKFRARFPSSLIRPALEAQDGGAP